MANIWFISDTHFQHKNILSFTGDDGVLIRPGFSSIDEMDETMIENWNKVVSVEDKIYHLGDVGFGSEKGLATILKRLKGKKRLCWGNHDWRYTKALAAHFQKCYLWRIFKEYNFTCSHIPLRMDQLRKTEFNVHGHIHQNTVICQDGLNKVPYPYYISVCVEKTGYAPVHLDYILDKIKKGE